MAQSRNSRGVYVTAGADVAHGAPAADGPGGADFVGFAQKIKQEGPDVGYGSSTNYTVKSNEEYFLVTKGTGIASITDGAGGDFAKGDAVYIDASNVLTSTSATNKKFGRVLAIEGERGVPTGKCLIDLDLKSSF